MGGQVEILLVVVVSLDQDFTELRSINIGNFVPHFCLVFVLITRATLC